MKRPLLLILTLILLLIGLPPGLLAQQLSPTGLLAAADPAAAVEASLDEPARAVAKKNALQFRNGDLLYGSLVSIDPQHGIRWQHPDASQTIEFSADGVAEIEFAPRQVTRPNSANHCLVQLINQDEIEGVLTLTEPDKILLETWYAGTLTIPRSMVRSIIPSGPVRNVKFEGPKGIEDWIIGNVQSAGADAGQFRYRAGAFYATKAASIARNVNLPDVASIRFDIAWRGNLFMALALYTEYMHPINLSRKETEPDFGGFYSLQLNNFSANLLPVNKQDPLRYLGQVPIPMLSQKNTAQIEIRVHKIKRSIALLVDDVLVKQWVDADKFVGTGTGIRLVHQGLGALKFSNLQITDWDGQFEEFSRGSSPVSEDSARLRNGDRLAGKLEKIADGSMVFDIGLKKLEVPLGRVRQIDLAKTTPAKNFAEANTKAFFHRRGSVSFQLETWSDRGITAISPALGAVTFDPNSFARIEFTKPPLQRGSSK
ncbi:MAG: hypothetical protein AB1813_11275 [Verrucomicrobiota bacterium]